MVKTMDKKVAPPPPISWHKPAIHTARSGNVLGNKPVVSMSMNPINDGSLIDNEGVTHKL